MSVKRRSQTPVLIVYVVTMLISLVVFGAVALTLLDIFVTQPRLARQASAEAGNTSDEVEAETTDDYSSARETILFVGADGDTINGIALIRVIPDQLAVKIVPVSPYTYTSVSGAEGTVAELNSIGGFTYLKSAVETAFGVTCDKYIKINNDGWRSFVEYLGGTSDYYFPEDLYYKNEANDEITSFSQGMATRTLYGDDIRRIMTYPLYSSGSEMKVQVVGELSTALINSACTYNRSSVVSNIQNIFNAVFNNSDTDITAKGFAEVRPAYEYLISNSTAPATYRIPTGTWDGRGYFIPDEAFKAELLTYFGMAEEETTLIN